MRRQTSLALLLDAANERNTRDVETIKARDAEIQTLRVTLKGADLLPARVATLESALATAYRERDDARQHNTRLRERLARQNRQAVALVARLVKMYRRAQSGKV